MTGDDLVGDQRSRQARLSEVDEAIRTARDEFVDLAEEALEELIAKRDVRAVTFVFRALGKERVYGERLEIGQITDEMLDRAIAEERAKLRALGDDEHRGRPAPARDNLHLTPWPLATSLPAEGVGPCRKIRRKGLFG